MVSSLKARGLGRALSSLPRIRSSAATTANATATAGENGWGMAVGGLFQGYMAYNMARKALTVAAPGLSSSLSLTKTDIGLVSSSFTAAYGVSKLISSVITDHVDCRVLFTSGLLLAGVLSLFFSIESQLPQFCLLWSIHGAVQGVGWPSLARMCLDRVPVTHQGKVWASLTAAGNLGHVVAGPLLLGLNGGSSSNWKGVMRAAGGAAVVAATAAWVMTAEPSEEDKSDGSTANGSSSSSSNGGGAPCRRGPLTLLYKIVEVLIDMVKGARQLVRWRLIMLLIGDALTYFVIKGLADWSVMGLTEYKGLLEKEAAGVFFYCEVGAIVGSFAAGYISDKVGGKRISTAACFALLCLPFLQLAYRLPSSPPLKIPGSSTTTTAATTPRTLAPFVIVYFMMGFFINGPKTLLGIAVRQAVPPNLAGTASGIQGWMGQCGTTWAGAPVGFLAHHYGWGAIYHLFMSVTFMAGMFFLVPALQVENNVDILTPLKRGWRRIKSIGEGASSSSTSSNNSKKKNKKAE